MLRVSETIPGDVNKAAGKRENCAAVNVRRLFTKQKRVGGERGKNRGE